MVYVARILIVLGLLSPIQSYAYAMAASLQNLCVQNYTKQSISLTIANIPKPEQTTNLQPDAIYCSKTPVVFLPVQQDKFGIVITTAVATNNYVDTIMIESMNPKHASLTLAHKNMAVANYSTHLFGYCGNRFVESNLIHVDIVSHNGEMPTFKYNGCNNSKVIYEIAPI